MRSLTMTRGVWLLGWLLLIGGAGFAQADALSAALPSAAGERAAGERAADERAADERAADEAPAPALFRIFLKDGTTVASYGEFARVGERVVFSTPIGDSQQRMASVGVDDVDWMKTDRYSNAVRAAHYAGTRGEAEYAAMSAAVAGTLTEISLATSVDDQLRLADAARRVLTDWPKDHFGYKTQEIHETLGVLDEIIGGLRAKAGRSSFDLNLVAGVAPPQVEPLMGPPSLQESIAQVLRLSTLAASPAERVDLLNGALTVLEASGGSEPKAWAAPMRGRLRTEIEKETRTDRAYAELASTALSASQQRAARADVKGLTALRDRMLARDERLGRKRPEQMQALLATLDQRLDGARRLRLARDRWTAQARAYRAYEQAIAAPVDLLQRSAAQLGDIRSLAGPPAAELVKFTRRLSSLAPALRRLTPPAELRAAHASLLSAWGLAEAAAAQRARAIAGNDMKLAWDASAAAAGALMLFDRARTDLAQAVKAPELQ
jgi:hypothetical protein